ncbi:glycosyltransferase [Microcoleus vaginatus]|uniref:glycosyltransferase n=1 Tax=Microcoleus vaginatus TaxID=119532 RepID=UPI001687B18E|nr:glycosyltransferase [Microcoleus sp. FACHB-84]MBD2008829.1 glycosyltransferase [Microcoleus sp. FACHB-45]
MTHFGLLTLPQTGHLNTMLPLGQELQRRGHQVTLFGILDAQAKTLAAGLDFQVLAEAEFPNGWTAQKISQQAKLAGFAAFRYSVNWGLEITAMLLREAPQALETADVEALLVDQMLVEGRTLAEFLNIPFITVCSSLMVNWDRDNDIPPYFTRWDYNPTSSTARLHNQRNYLLLSGLGQPFLDLIAQYRREWNLTPHYLNHDENFSQLAQICQQPAEFEFPRQHLPPHFHFTGPYASSASRESVLFPFEKLTGQPLIYASMGTIQNRQFQVFRDIAQACMGLDAQLVISLGGGATPESLPELPGNPLVVRYAPQLELLQKATLTITHAGLNTVLESLSYGVPMVAIPLVNDQPGTAARIVWTGVGEAIPIAHLNVSNLRSAIAKVLSEDSYKKNALRLQAAIGRAGGVSRAIDIVEQAVSTGKPVLAQSL